MKKAPNKELLEQIKNSKNRTKAMKESGVTVCAFYYHCKKHGINLVNEKSSYVLTARDEDLIAQLKEAGFSVRKIAEKFEVRHSTIVQRLHRRAKGILPKQSEDLI